MNLGICTLPLNYIPTPAYFYIYIFLFEQLQKVQLKKPIVTDKIYDMIQYYFLGMQNVLMTPEPRMNETNTDCLCVISSLLISFILRVHENKTLS